MSWTYLSHFLSEQTPGYGGSPGMERAKVGDMCHGATSNSERWSFNNHLGTHIDLPRHFDPNGKTLSDYPADYFHFTKVVVTENLQLEKNQLIHWELIGDYLDQGTELLLVRTGFERFRGIDRCYWEENPSFDEETCLKLREDFPNLRMMGFDFISLSPYQNRVHGRHIHRLMLAPHEAKRPLLLLEDAKLGHLPATKLNLREAWVTPFAVENADGTPVTVVAAL